MLVRCYTEDELPLMPSLTTLTHRVGKVENGLSQTGFDWFPGYFPVWLLTSKLGYGQDLSTPSCFLPVLPFDLKMGLGEKGSPFYLCQRNLGSLKPIYTTACVNPTSAPTRICFCLLLFVCWFVFKCFYPLSKSKDL